MEAHLHWALRPGFQGPYSSNRFLGRQAERSGEACVAAACAASKNGLGVGVC